MNCSRYDDMNCIIKFINIMLINLMFIHIMFMFGVRAEGEATITISTRCCCQIKRGWAKKQDFRNPVVLPTTRSNELLPRRWWAYQISTSPGPSWKEGVVTRPSSQCKSESPPSPLRKYGGWLWHCWSSLRGLLQQWMCPRCPLRDILTWGGLGPQDFLTKPQLPLRVIGYWWSRRGPDDVHVRTN